MRTTRAGAGGRGRRSGLRHCRISVASARERGVSSGAIAGSAAKPRASARRVWPAGADPRTPPASPARYARSGGTSTGSPKAVTSAGYPAGWVYGEVTGDGDLMVDPDELVKLLEEADRAGSWEEMDALDLVLYVNTGDLELKVEVFGIKLDFPDVKIDAKGGEKLTHTIKFEVTGAEYVHINGGPLARARR